MSDEVNKAQSPASSDSNEKEATLPVILPESETVEVSSRTGRDGTCASIPGFETPGVGFQAAGTCCTHVLLLSIHATPKYSFDESYTISDQHCRFTCEHYSSLETYQQAVGRFRSVAKSENAAEMVIVLEIATTASCQPVIGGQVVMESELYAPLDCSKDQTLTSLRMFILKCPTDLPATSLSTDTKRAPKRVSGDDDDWHYTAPNRAPLSGTEIVSIDIKNGQVDWQDVFRALGDLNSGAKMNTDEVQSNIVRCCPGARFRRLSGVPSAEACAIFADASTESVDAPAIPETLDDQSSTKPPQIAPSVRSEESSKGPNVSLEIVIDRYLNNAKCGLHRVEDRKGSEKDKESFGKARRHLKHGFEHVFPDVPNIHTYSADPAVPVDACPAVPVDTLPADPMDSCPTVPSVTCLGDPKDVSPAVQMDTSSDGYVSKRAVLDFIRKVVWHYKRKKISPFCVFLFISAHGDEKGILTSEKENITLQELVLPLTELGGYVLVFYQACRGHWYHRAMAGKSARSPFDCGLGFDCGETAGCVLPLTVPRTAAIFASLPGFEAYRNEQTGSWMPRALADSLSRINGTVDVRQLAERMQARLRELFPVGFVECRRYTAFIQIHYSLGEGCEDLRLEVGPASRAEKTGAEPSECSDASASMASLLLRQCSEPE